VGFLPDSTRQSAAKAAPPRPNTVSSCIIRGQSFFSCQEVSGTVVFREGKPKLLVDGVTVSLAQIPACFKGRPLTLREGDGVDARVMEIVFFPARKGEAAFYAVHTAFVGTDVHSNQVVAPPPSKPPGDAPPAVFSSRLELSAPQMLTARDQMVNGPEVIGWVFDPPCRETAPSLPWYLPRSMARKRKSIPLMRAPMGRAAAVSLAPESFDVHGTNAMLIFPVTGARAVLCVEDGVAVSRIEAFVREKMAANELSFLDKGEAAAGARAATFQRRTIEAARLGPQTLGGQYLFFLPLPGSWPADTDIWILPVDLCLEREDWRISGDYQRRPNVSVSPLDVSMQIDYWQASDPVACRLCCEEYIPQSWIEAFLKQYHAALTSLHE